MKSAITLICLLTILVLPAAPGPIDARADAPAQTHSAPDGPSRDLTLEEIRVTSGGAIEKIVRRHIVLDVGDVIDPARLLYAREQLEALKTIKEVDVYTSPGSRPGKVVLHVEAKLDRGYHFESGLGYEPLERWYLNLISVRYTNLLNRGGHWLLGYRSTNRADGFYLEKFYPRLFGEDFDLIQRSEAVERMWPVWDGDRLLNQTIHHFKIDLGLRRWSRKDGFCTFWIGIAGFKPSDKLEDHDDDIEPNEFPVTGRLVPVPRGGEGHVALKMETHLDRRDPLRPWRTGYCYDLRLGFANSADIDACWGFDFDINGALPLRKTWALAGRFRAAAVRSATPYYLRPLLAGPGNLRGFRSGILSGPLGSLALWQVNGEWRVPLWDRAANTPRLTGTAFLDAGDNWTSGWTRQEFAASAGIGLQLRSPWVQVINFELAWPLTENPDAAGFNALITLGRSF